MLFPSYNHNCPAVVLLADWWTDSQWLAWVSLFYTSCLLSARCFHRIIVALRPGVTCYSTALLTPESDRWPLQLTGVNIVFQIFILYFYLLHYVDGINILVLKLIIVIYTFLTILFCCFTPEIAKIKTSPESSHCWSWEASNTTVCSRYFCSSWLFCCKQNNNKKTCQRTWEGHVYLSIVLLFSYSCRITVTLCCSSDLCNITFPPHKKNNIVAYYLFNIYSVHVGPQKQHLLSL